MKVLYRVQLVCFPFSDEETFVKELPIGEGHFEIHVAAFDCSNKLGNLDMLFDENSNEVCW